MRVLDVDDEGRPRLESTQGDPVGANTPPAFTHVSNVLGYVNPVK